MSGVSLTSPTCCRAAVLVANGQTNLPVATVPVGSDAAGLLALATNPLTNTIYATASADNTLSVINGHTEVAATVTVGSDPVAVATNPLTDTTYVANGADHLGPLPSAGSVSVIAG